MVAAVISRREMLSASIAGIFATVLRPAHAMGRLPLGGSVSLRLPHDTSRLDPHDLHDAMAALIGSAVFDPVFGLDSTASAYPILAEGLPQKDGRNVRVTLREGLKSSRGRTLDATDLVASIERARSSGAAAFLEEVPKATVNKRSVRTAIFANADPSSIARALASPLVSFVSKSSTASRPDATGAFRAETSTERLVLTRNRFAARGPSLLDEIVIRRAADLSEPLRDFEAKSADIGWLGAGLHQPRPGSVAFDLGSAGWIVLRTGNEAGAWGAPGVAQTLVDAIPPGRLAHLALGRLPNPQGQPQWGGQPCELLVSSASVHLVEIAKSVASIISSPGHDVTVLVVPAQRSRSRAFSLMIDLVRSPGPPGLSTLLALASAEDLQAARSIARHPPRLSSFSPRVLARTLHLGVLGELRVAGATLPNITLPASPDGCGWLLGSAYRANP
jgi:peptide/nickel transport system substrate-binding protein